MVDNFLTVLLKAAKTGQSTSLTLRLLDDILDIFLTEGSLGESGTLLLISSVYRALKVKVPDVLQDLLSSGSEVRSDCVCVWSEERAGVFNQRVQQISDNQPKGALQSAVTAPLPISSDEDVKSPEAKRRKLSQEKENIEQAIYQLEYAVDVLLMQDRRDLVPFKEAVEYYRKKIQDILMKIL